MPKTSRMPRIHWAESKYGLTRPDGLQHTGK